MAALSGSNGGDGAGQRLLLWRRRCWQRCNHKTAFFFGTARTVLPVYSDGDPWICIEALGTLLLKSVCTIDVSRYKA